MIEDFFEPSVRNTKLNGKIFNPSDKGFNSKTEYGKNHFAKYVVLKNQAKTSKRFKLAKKILKQIIKMHIKLHNENSYPKIV